MLAEAASWLRSDWRPLGTALPDGAGDARAKAIDLIGQANRAIHAVSRVGRVAVKMPPPCSATSSASVCTGRSVLGSLR